MSSDPTALLHVSFTPEFKRNLWQLAKKYRHIKTDVPPILDDSASGGVSPLLACKNRCDR